MGGRQRDLKADAIPTIVAHKPAFKVRTTSRARAAKQKRQQVRGNVDFQSWNALLIRRDKVCLISGIIITALSPFCEFSNNNIGSSSYVHCSHMLKWKKFTVFLWYLSFLSPFQWAYMNEAWRSSRSWWGLYSGISFFTSGLTVMWPREHWIGRGPGIQEGHSCKPSISSCWPYGI